MHKYADVSSRFGLGYLLSNNCIGVRFNDGSVMSQSLTKRVAYLKSSRNEDSKNLKNYFENEVPERLQYKYNLFKEFEA